MRVVKITDKLSVAKQPAVEEFGEIAGAGFSALINNRPDGEDQLQPGSAAEAKAASAAGLAYTHIPVTGATITAADVHKFHEAVEAADGPVLAHCKGGTRSLSLFVIGEVLAGRMRADEVRPFGARHGFDLAGAEAWLRSNGYAE
jgi:uncharacterized protein (TIGR01244 family)